MSRALFKATSLVGGMTFLSRILGFIRDMVMARYFGAGMVMDAFFVAFKIPNFMRRTFGEGAFSLAFVPVISEYKTTHTHPEVQELTDRVAGTFGLVLFGVTLVGVIAAPVVVWIFAPGF
ncbi:MAG TPA: lipid II flippase MurJ, partial [Gammaproteobacteria bacterium]|nr:lipid II flippase MurJ [Gammaproteobacteria bacterium]